MYHANLVVLKTRNLLKLTDGLETTPRLSNPMCVCVCVCYPHYNMSFAYILSG